MVKPPAVILSFGIYLAILFIIYVCVFLYEAEHCAFKVCEGGDFDEDCSESVDCFL